MKLLLTVLFLLLVLLSPLFHPGMYQSHDGEAQMARFANFYQALQDGQMPVRWAGKLNFAYGTPVFIFFYPLPGYLASFLHAIGFDYQTDFKILIFLAFIFSFWTFFLWAKTLFSNPTALLGALLYVVAPYHFLNIYIRGDIGEVLIFAFLPLVFWSIEKLIVKQKIIFILLGGISYALIILSHHGLGLMFSPVIAAYALMRSTNKKILLFLSLIFIVGLLLSSFFWLPSLYDSKYLNSKQFSDNYYQSHFPSFSQLIFSSWGYGTQVQEPGGLSPQVGLINFIFIIFSIYFFFKVKKQRKIMGFWLIVFLLGIFLTLSISDFFWQHLAMLRLYQFPWRFVGISTLAAVVLSCIVLEHIKNKKWLIIIAITVYLSSVPFVRVKGFIDKNDQYYSYYAGSTAYHGEASTVWTAGDPYQFAKKQVEIIGGNGKISNLYIKSQLHTFTIDSRGSVLLDNTIYFPGWTVKIDGQKVPIQFQDPNHRGLISFQVPEGRHRVSVFFGETRERFIANIISLSTFVIVLIFFIRFLVYNKKARKI